MVLCLAMLGCSPEVADPEAAAQESLVVPRQLLVKTRRPELLSEYGEVFPGLSVGWWRLQLPTNGDPQVVQRALALEPRVAEVQFNLRYFPDVLPSDPDYGQQYAHRITHAPAGWDIRSDAPDVVVAVIGTGIASAHPELQRRMWNNPLEIAGNGIDDDANGFIDDIQGWDFQDNDGQPLPSNTAHETAAACVIGAEANNGIGGSGVVWNARIMSLRVDYQSDQVAAAIRYAVDQGAQVINMSFGSYVYNKYGPDGIVREALDYAEANDVVAVATAGNDSIDRQRYPAAHDKVIAVAASTSGDRRASFSNYGPWVTLVAPGHEIYSCGLVGDTIVSGTSFAAPYVAGVAALLRAEHPQWPAPEVRHVLEVSGDSIRSPNPVGLRINVQRALMSSGFPDVYARIRNPYAQQVYYIGSQVQIVGTAVGGTYQVEWEAFPGSPVQSGPVYDGALATLDTTGLTEGVHRIRLRVQGANQAMSEDVVVVRLRGGGLPGFPIDASNANEVAVGDIDGDGDFEAVLLDRLGVVHAVHHDGTSVMGFPVSHRGWAGSLALGDVDGDGDVEIVAAADPASSQPGWLAAWHSDASLVAGFDKLLPGRIHSGPVLADVNANGSLEVIVVTTGRSLQIHVFDGEGRYLPGWPASIAGQGNILGGPDALVVANLDMTPQLEIAVAGVALRVYGADGQPKPGWPRRTNGNRLLAVDLDDDGISDLVLPRSGTVLAFHGDGRPVFGWPQFSGMGWPEGLAVGDLDGDARPEVVVVDGEGADRAQGTVRLWRADGGSTPGWPKTVENVAVNGGPLLSDLDGDGHPDIVVISAPGDIYAWNADGRALAGYPRALSVDLKGPFVLTDLDHNDILDLIAVGPVFASQVHGFELGVRHELLTSEWSSARGNAHRTGAWARRFDLEVGSPADGQILLTIEVPTDIPTPSAYIVYRDGLQVGRVSEPTWLDSGAERRGHTYDVIALDETGGRRARSRSVAAAWPELWCQGRVEGTACDDANPCTRDDVCRSGNCRGTNDDNAACDDGDQCSAVDVCRGGSCVGEARVICEARACHDVSCRPSSGECVASPHAEGAACEDGLLCTVNDTCQATICTGAAVECDYGDEICGARGVCDPMSGQCSKPAVPDGEACDDNIPCTRDAACRQGRCRGKAVVCQPISGCDVLPACNIEADQCVLPAICRSLPESLATVQDSCGCTGTRGPSSGPRWGVLGLLLAVGACRRRR